MNSYSASLSLSNEPSHTLIGQCFTTLTSSPGPYLLPSPVGSGTDIAKQFVAACRAYLEALILSELYLPAHYSLQQMLGTIHCHLLVFASDQLTKCMYYQAVSCIGLALMNTPLSPTGNLIRLLNLLLCSYQLSASSPYLPLVLRSL